MYFDQNKPDEALLSLRKAIETAREAPELLQRFVLPVIEKGNSCDNRRITDYLWQSVYNHKNEYQVKALLHLANELSGDVHSFIGESDNAQNAYDEAISYLPLPGCIKKAAPFILKSLNFEKLLEITEEGLTNSPYDSILVLYKALALLKKKQTYLAINILKEHKNALKSFKDFHRIIRIRQSMKIIMISMYINKNISSKLILKIIRILV
jgi:tetratricopeptide (TPR) repeat protein